MILAEYNDAIRSREDFLQFAKAFADDFQENPDSWENDTLERFLSALHAWVESMEGYYLNRNEVMPEQPCWKMLGDILMAAKVYE